MPLQALIAAVAKLIRGQPRNPDAIAVDEALRAFLATGSVSSPVSPAAANKSNGGLTKSNRSESNTSNGPGFDKRTYQRDLMRKRRADAKAKLTE